MDFGICQTEMAWGERVMPAVEVTRAAQEIAELGATAVRMSCTWADVEPNRNHKYRFGNVDRAVEAAEAAGLDILLIIETRRLSFWSILGIPVGIAPTSKNATDYGLMCGAVAAQYGDRIRWYEIGNEINNLAAFGAPKDPADYLEFLRLAYQGIKPHAPASTVLAGALMAVATDPYPTGVSLHPVEWVKAFYEANPQDWFDGISIHPYSTGGVFDPLPPTPDNEYAFANLPLIRALMDANDDVEKPLIMSEWGFDSVRSLTGMSVSVDDLEAEQAQHIETQWNLLSTYADSGVIYPTVFVYNYHDRRDLDDDDAWYKFGITRKDWFRKPAWYFLRSLVIDPNIEIPLATLQLQAWMPTIEEFIDPQHPKAPEVTFTLTAHVPTVESPIQPPAVTFTLTAHVPAVDVLEPIVELVSVATGDRDLPPETSTAHVEWTHPTIGEDIGRLFLVPIVVAHSNFRAWENYMVDGVVESDLGGPLLRLASRHIGSASVRRGSVHWYGLYHPEAAAHTFSVDLDEATTGFTALAATSLYLRGASDFGVPAANGSSAGGNTQRVAIATLVDHLTVALFGSTDAMSGSFNQDVEYAAGSIVEGHGDYITVASTAGITGTVTYEDVGGGLEVFGAIALDVPNITGLQKPMNAPAVALSLQAHVPLVGTQNTISPPVKTMVFTAHGPDVAELIQPPAPNLTLTAHVPTVETDTDINPPVATITLTAHVPTVGVAAISHVSNAGAEGSTTQTLTMPTHQTGDYLLMYAYNSNFSTLPTLPSGWTNIATESRGDCGARLAYKVAASASETSGDWGSATNSLVCHVYRGVNSIGAVATTDGSGATITIPAVTLQDSDGSSWVAAFCAITNASGGNLTTPPSGMTTRADIETGNNSDTAGYDTNGGVTSWAGGTVNHTVGAQWSSAAVELKT